MCTGTLTNITVQLSSMGGRETSLAEKAKTEASSVSDSVSGVVEKVEEKAQKALGKSS